VGDNSGPAETIDSCCTMKGRQATVKTADKKSTKKRAGPEASAAMDSPGTSSRGGVRRSPAKVLQSKEILPRCCGCSVEVSDEVNALQCDRCEMPEMWKCADCLGLAPATYKALFTCKELKWLCANCEGSALRMTGGMEERMESLTTAVELLCKRMCGIEQLMKDMNENVAVAKVNEVVLSLETRVLNVENDQKKRPEMERVQVENVERNVSRAGAVLVSEALELEERLRRRTSLIVHGFRESESDDPMIRKEEDLKRVTGMFEEMGCGEVEVQKIFRLGKRADGMGSERAGPRPAKVVLKSEDEKIDVLKRAKNLRVLREGVWKEVYIHQDLTPREREERRGTVEEMRARRVSGERNLIEQGGRIVKRDIM